MSSLSLKQSSIVSVQFRQVLEWKQSRVIMMKDSISNCRCRRTVYQVHFIHRRPFRSSRCKDARWYNSFDYGVPLRRTLIGSNGDLLDFSTHVSSPTSRRIPTFHVRRVSRSWECKHAKTWPKDCCLLAKMLQCLTFMDYEQLNRTELSETQFLFESNLMVNSYLHCNLFS